MAGLKKQILDLGGLLYSLMTTLLLTCLALLRVAVNAVLFVASGGLYMRWSCSHGAVNQDAHEDVNSGASTSTDQELRDNSQLCGKHVPKTSSRLGVGLLLESSSPSATGRGVEQVREDIVFIPSQSMDQRELAKVTAVVQYEERQLCILFKLANPNVRIVYVTSKPIDACIVDYYLELLEQTNNVSVGNARSRLLLLSCNDPRLIPLTDKILRRPKLIKKIKEFIEPSCSYMIPYVSTNLERELALTLQIPLIGTDPSLNYWGTKAGSREVFELAGLPLPAGTGLALSEEDLAAEVLKLYLREGKPRQIVIKLNVGFSGKGNALLTASKISPDETVKRVIEVLETDLEFCSLDETREGFLEQMKIYGAIAEIWVPNVVSSPSVQATILVSGEVKVISTHEQVLDGGAYLGCTFPANENYKSRLIDYAYKVGIVLADKGCLERFAVDFVVSQSGAEIEVNCIEINIRWGGTSHPFISAKYLTNGEVNQDGSLIGADGLEKFYFTADNFQSDALIYLNPDDFLDLTRSSAKLSFSSVSLTGVTFHLISAIPQFGKFGMIAIANSREEAYCMHQQALRELETLAKEGVEEKVFLELDLSINSQALSN